MPDENKFAVLQQVGFRIHRTCDLCVHSELNRSEWGTCALHKYEHKKHDNPDGGRGVSIHRSRNRACRS